MELSEDQHVSTTDSSPEVRSQCAAQKVPSADQASCVDPIECAICFEHIECVTSLPCSCRVDYCFSCWDRSLAQSFLSCGYARCPTCRTSIRVDYDADTGRLLFSQARLQDRSEDKSGEIMQEEDEEAEDDGLSRVQETFSQMRNRLIEQAWPAQIRILKQYGELQRISAAEGGSASSTAPMPKCVCGGFLEKVSCKERIRRFCVVRLPQLPPGSEAFERAVEAIAASGRATYFCDLCSESIRPLGEVWTCENADRTILHSNAYDICEACFAKHAFGEGAAASTQEQQRLTPAPEDSLRETALAEDGLEPPVQLQMSDEPVDADAAPPGAPAQLE
eukprot:gnl/TRDRNA2_/TRDRNA2_94469_c0_seq1.p1 gnl/TRDRNA2_/TRDRNA2_94469_c0~~gnl/TRDRNA2_/TRDRNA2_94469_c0_seq1.p1  ORF type:complete len:335 (+),score=55.68 gnl/TRDRNA2_/TRDRNA2_94469_c0_seq1:67-1071(+)